MYRQDLSRYLDSKYNVICLEEIEQIKNSYQKIFDVFKQHYRPEFLPTDRLIFFGQYRPEPGFLRHVQKAATLVDISNYFILWVTPEDIDLDLQQVNSQLGFDDTPMQSLRLPIEHASAKVLWHDLDYDTICPLPFMKLDMEPGGRAAPCCRINTRFGNLNHATVNEIFHSQELVALRQKILTGQRATECSACWQTESLGSTSLRQHALNKYGRQLFESGVLDTPRLLDITLTPHSTCDFKCRICSAAQSTAISAEIMTTGSAAEKSKVKQILRQNLPLSWTRLTQLFAQEVFADITNLHILGGEPFLWSRLPDFLAMVAEHTHNRPVALTINTNGNHCPDIVTKLPMWFKSVEILISLDDLGERFELQRGGRWADVETVIKQFAAQRSQSFMVKFACSVSLLNVLYLDQLVDFANGLDIDLVWNYVQDPEFLCVDQSTQYLKELIHQRYENHACPELSALAQRVLLTPAGQPDHFFQYMQALDNRRHQDWTTAHGELYRAMLQP